MPAIGEEERLIETGPNFQQERRRLTLGYLADREICPDSGNCTPVKQLFRYWQAKRTPNRLPSTSRFEPQSVFDGADFEWVSWIDVTPEDPFNFILHHHPGSGEPVTFLGDWSGHTLKDYPHNFHATRCAFEYQYCKSTRQPVYHEISQTIEGYYRCYTRVLLPLEDLDGVVTTLFYATRYVTPPERFSDHA